jgi:hypothetical protein
MNIFVGKIGRSISFNSSKWGVTGGDNEGPKFYENLFVRNPDKTFYIIGSNDFSKLSYADQQRINKHGNVIDIWKGLGDWKKKNPEVEQYSVRRLYLEEYVKDIKFDCGVVFAGPTGTSNVHGKSTLMKDPTTLAKTIMMVASYAGPMLSFLNEYKLPYALVVTDPRYFPPNARDWMHPPTVVLSQYEEIVKFTAKNHYTTNETAVHNVPSVYAGIEKCFLIGLTRGEGHAASNAATLDSFFEDTVVSETRDRGFMIVMHEGKRGMNRYQVLKDDILNHVQNIEIYGEWDKRTIGDDSRFKGALPFHKLQELLPRVKYTYCVPIKKGWVTSKFWEMAHHGVIPFLHKTYDEQRHMKAPDFLYIKDSKDLFDKIKFLEDNPAEYQKMRDTIDGMLKDEFYNGERLNNLTMTELNRIAQ